MQEVIEKAVDFIALFNAVEFSRTPKPVTGEHIYFDLESVAGKYLDPSVVMGMFYFFQQNERCLKALRLRSWHTADLIYGKVEGIDKNIDPLVDCGIMSLFLAMSAYRDYVNNAYVTAKDKLNTAMELCIEQSVLVPGFLIAMEEQWLNSIRVDVRKDRSAVDEMGEQFAKLFAFAYTGVAGRSDYSEVFSKNSHVQVETGINNLYIQFLRIIDTLYPDTSSSCHLYASVLTGLSEVVARFDAEYKFPISLSVDLLAKYYRNETASFITGITDNIVVIKSLPVFIKKKIVTAYLTAATTIGLDIQLVSGYQLFSEMISKEMGIIRSDLN